MKQTVEQTRIDMARAELSKYADIPSVEWDKLLKMAKIFSLNKNEYFIRIGDRPDKLAFITKGLFRVLYLTETGDERILAFRAEKRLLTAYSSFLEQKESWIDIQALENSELLYITLDNYRQLLPGHPCWQTIAARYAELLFMEKERRESELLSDDAETRYEKFKMNHPGLETRLRQYHIASYLGITPVALSRIRKRSGTEAPAPE